MSKHAFDTIHHRRSTGSIKWNRYDENIIPLWVADMDFKVADPITKALREAVDFAIHGYNMATDSLNNLIVDKMQSDYNWQIKSDHIVWLPGLVPALNVACRMVEGAVISHSPIYPPFLSAPKLTGKELVNIPMLEENGLWSLPTPKLKGHEKLLLFCNPHNPLGRVFSKEELKTLQNWIIKNDLIVCSDEVHCGLILDETKKHLPLASLSKEIENRSITLMAPSKTYNLPGLNCAFAIIPNSKLRTQFLRQSLGIVSHASTLGLVACEAAYRDGEDWRLEVLEYLRGNADEIEKFINEETRLSWTRPEATYLAWINITKLNLTNPTKFFQEAGVGIQCGSEFGLSGYIRLNFACSRKLLIRALELMKKAISNL